MQLFDITLTINMIAQNVLQLIYIEGKLRKQWLHIHLQWFVFYTIIIIIHIITVVIVCIVCSFTWLYIAAFIYIIDRWHFVLLATRSINTIIYICCNSVVFYLFCFCWYLFMYVVKLLHKFFDTIVYDTQI